MIGVIAHMASTTNGDSNPTVTGRYADPTGGWDVQTGGLLGLAARLQVLELGASASQVAGTLCAERRCRAG